MFNCLDEATGQNSSVFQGFLEDYFHLLTEISFAPAGSLTDMESKEEFNAIVFSISRIDCEADILDSCERLGEMLERVGARSLGRWD